MEVKKGRIILVCLVTLGLTSTFTQIYLIREFLSVFFGNELVIGIVLACWMLLTGAGAYLGKFLRKIRGQLGFILFLQFFLAILPLLSIVKLDLWRSVMFPYGSMPSLTDIIYASFLLQLPFCLLNGYLFTSYTFLASEFSGQNRTGMAYATESFGSVIGGMIVNFFLLWFTGTFQSLQLLLLLNLLTGFIFSQSFCRKRTTVIFISASLIVAPVLILPDFVRIAQKWLYPQQKVIINRSTPYGTVIVTENAGQLNFYENGLLMFSSNNEIFNEEAVHFAMIQHPSPKKVLLISGGVAGILKEIKKYNPDQIDYLELNPAITGIGRSFNIVFNDPVVKIYNEDARRFIKRNTRKFDVVLINLPEPSTLQINRFYTHEFFADLRSRLNPGAVISIGLPSTADYVSESGGRLNGSLYNTLKRNFGNVIILPGQKNYFLASDGPLTSGISGLISQKGIPTVYVNTYYFDDQLLKDRSDFIINQLPSASPQNYDFSPVTFFYQLQFWTSYFNTDYIILFSLLLIIIILVLISLNPVSFGLFTGGFTASSISILIILAFQVFYGFVFIMAGIMIMLFMAGLATGSILRKKIILRETVKGYLVIQVFIGIFALVFPFIIIGLHLADLPDYANYAIMGILTLVISVLAGMEYTAASSLQSIHPGHIASKNYSADLFGSALGVFLTSVLLLPLAGLIYTSLILVLLNFISILILVFSNKKAL